ncbi:cation:proton antiporter [Atopococcus tabaci]|uniref:cation:proton antiporter domain-containing protein n=1 Tax=Atopococcus tabaci TaxID=269774 RepID=UPI00040B650B|nr:cation:proton antiporter [Atopococcus tabaci]
MLTSIALIFLTGMCLGAVFKRIGLPSLVGMILTGILLGPSVLDVLDESLLAVSTDLRQVALVIILFRAGLSLSVEDLKKIGLPAVLMSFVPAVLEIIGIVLLAPLLFGISVVDAAVMGAVVAAVSPAVVVPAMLHIMEQGYGQKRRVPQLVLAGASMDDVFVIVLFSSFLALSLGGEITVSGFLEVPVAIVTGVVVGALSGWLLQKVYRSFHMRDTAKIMMLLSVSFLLLEAETLFSGFLPMSGLLAIMAMGLALNQFYPELAARLSGKYNKLWAAAQILLFVLVGASVDVAYALQAGEAVIVLILGALVFRVAGVLLSLWPSSLNKKEKMFAAISYMPKATVQAAIGAVPLSEGLASGQLILTAAVAAILLTAPLGSFLIEKTYKKLLDSPKDITG